MHDKQGASDTIANMKTKIFQTALFIAMVSLIGVGSSAFAHPHAFVTCTLSFVMDEKGLAGFHQRWTLDELTTVSVLDVVDKNRDATLSAEEKVALRDLTVGSLREFHYFTAVRINGRDFPVRRITGFTAELRENRLVYDFLVPCPVAAVPGHPQQVKVAVYDDAFYTYVAYASEGDAGVDPSKDPKFANREAPAHPEDFKRFSKTVGIGKYIGKIRITGETAGFKVTFRIKDAPDMAYFYGQIVPQTFVIDFEPR